MPLLEMKVTVDASFPNARAVQRDFMQRIAALAHGYWSQQATLKLKRTQADYIQAIQRPQVTDTEAVISLVGWLPTKLELGMSAFDQKPGLLSHRSDGKFVIPFEHQTPNTVGIRAAPMPTDIYASLVAQGCVTKIDAGNTGMRSKWNSMVGNPSSAPKGSYTFKSSPYSGMVLSKQKGSRGGVTFRTVSRNSDPSSFIHPGLKALQLRKSVIEFLESQAPKVFQASVKSMGGGK